MESFKNYIIAFVVALVSGYVIKQKYDALQAESKLKDIEAKIVKTNIEIIKKSAKMKSKLTEAETSSEIETLRELKVQRAKVNKEMKILVKTLESNSKPIKIKG